MSSRDWFIVLGFVCGALMGRYMLSIPGNSASLQKSEQVVEQAPVKKDQLPEQIELLCIQEKLFVRDRFGHGSLVQVGEGGSNSVPCD